MKKLALLALAALILVGCQTLITPKGDITKIPGARTAKFTALSADPSSATTGLEAVPGPGPSFTGIVATASNLLMSWNNNTGYTVNGSLYPNGPWSAITNANSPVAVPYPAPLLNYGSNRNYRLSLSTVGLDRYYMGGLSFAAPVGNNDIAIAANDNHWSQQDYFFTLTNGVFTGFPINAPGITPCGPLAMAIDTARWQLYTVESECYHGWSSGPYKLWTWQLTGTEGLFTDAEPVKSEVFGGADLGSTWGDMIRLESGGIVACWKAPDATKNYCFAYRNPAGQWQPIICRPEVEQRSSTVTLGQHPNGDVYAFVTRDGLHPIPTVIFKEIGGRLVWQSTQQDRFRQEGEWSKTQVDPDPANNRLIVSRTFDPHIFFRAGEAWLTVKGSCMRSAYWYNETTVAESPTFPNTYTNSSNGSIHPVNQQEVFIFVEPINHLATALVDGKLWVIKQEFNPNEERFNLVYAQPLENNVWGERHYLYRAPDCDNCRGRASNWLTRYRNVDPNPKRVFFGNVNEEGEAELFELLR